MAKCKLFPNFFTITYQIYLNYGGWFKGLVVNFCERLLGLYTYILVSHIG